MLFRTLWRPAARRACNMVGPLAPTTHESGGSWGLSIGPLPWLVVSTSNGGTPAVGVRQLAFALRCAEKRPHCAARASPLAARTVDATDRHPGRVLVRGRAAVGTPPPGTQRCCEDTGLWLGQLGVKGPWWRVVRAEPGRRYRQR